MTNDVPTAAADDDDGDADATAKEKYIVPLYSLL